MAEPGDITLLLQLADQGDGQAADQLFRLVEKELRAIASRRQKQINQDVTLTGLVDQAFCRLVGENNTQWGSGDRRKFFKYAAIKMHNILIDELRAKQTEKRGRDYERVDLESVELEDGGNAGQYQTMLLDLKAALDEMPAEAEIDEIVFRIRYFLGCTIEETAEILNLSQSDVKKSSQKTRSWLKWKMASYRQEVL